MRILSYNDLKCLKGVSYSKVHIWRLERAGKFPKRVPLGENRHGWLDSEIDEWILARVARRDGDALNELPKKPAHLVQPLEEVEVTRVAGSVWKMTTEGRNRFGQYGAWWSVNDVDRLVADPHLCTLLSWLKAHNRPERHFLVADGLKDKFGWPRRQLTQARRRAIEGGWIVQASTPRRGHAAVYVWGPAAKRVHQEAGKKIGSVYVEDSLPILVGHFVCPIRGQRGRL